MAINVLGIVQARMASTRFPGKVLKVIDGKTLIEILFHRLSRSVAIDRVILATTGLATDDVLCKVVGDIGIDVFRGSEGNVLERYYKAAKKYQAETIVRITGDCPLVDPVLVDEIIKSYQKADHDYLSNGAPATYPDGLDVEVFSFEALEFAYWHAQTGFDREHVTPFIRNSENFKIGNFAHTSDLSEERWTVDEPEDFCVIERVVNHFSPSLDFSWLEIVDLIESHPEYFLANRHIIRNEGAELPVGQKLWERAKKVIPGGNMLLSKRPEMFLPRYWPSYFSRAHGCKVWDLEGTEYVDMSIMGVGTNTLGYGHPEVDDAVRQAVAQGNMSTLNCPEEVYLAERLIELHPWAEMVRFARSGGEANAIAIRIARAATGKEKVAICGYHGWHDWYLAANLGDETRLDGHLLPGLEPRGVPKSLRGTTLPFAYNDLDSLYSLLKSHDIGVIKMEVSRSIGPEAGFLEAVRELATERSIVLVFDECTSGFRETYGGLHKKFGVEPDIAVFGKALGNGYPVTAVIGRRRFMDAAQTSFISSTFWTERIGSAAALKTLEVMEREKSWEQITATGRRIIEGWTALSEKHGLPLAINGLPAVSSFTMLLDNWLSYKTLISQEMLKQGFLSANTIYVCVAHEENIIREYLEHLDSVFGKISECETGKNIDNLLDGPVCDASFRRLN